MFEPTTFLEATFHVPIYLFVWGPVHALVAGLSLLLLLLRTKKIRCVVLVRDLLVLNICFLLVSALLNGIWHYSVWGWVYFRGDPFVDFNPFFPPTQEWVEQRVHGQEGKLLNGFGILHAQVIWLACAFADWMGTLLLYTRIRRTWNRKDTEHKNAELSPAAVAPDEA